MKQVDGKVFVLIGGVWFAVLISSFLALKIVIPYFANEYAGLGVDVSFGTTPGTVAVVFWFMRFAFLLLVLGWIPMLAIGAYRMRRKK